MLDHIQSERIWEHDSKAGALVDGLRQHGPESLLGILPNEPNPDSKDEILGKSLKFLEFLICWAKLIC